jgi:hypothetical protein
MRPHTRVVAQELAGHCGHIVTSFLSSEISVEEYSFWPRDSFLDCQVLLDVNQRNLPTRMMFNLLMG